ncbi:MAG: hypothetical protein Q7R96_01505 [Nanoarchaeota archaeon]|nr:hypothetical protein [Nanoarchaeota archaeon]
MKLFLVLFLVFFVACTQQVVQPVVQSPVDNATGVVSVNPFLVEVLAMASVSPNLQYRFSVLPRLNSEMVWLVGDRAKIEPVAGIVVPEYSFVYIDFGRKEALGKCVARSRIPCKEPGKQVVLPFDNFTHPTPYDWVKKVPVSAQVIGTEAFDRQEHTVVVFTDGAQQLKFWIHDFYKLPSKVEVLENEQITTYLYGFVSAGNIKVQDVVP